MNFSFDPSKAQQPALNQTLGTPGTMGAGDAGKSMSSSFGLPSMQNQPKPGGLFSSALAGTPAPTFGATTPGLQSTGLNLSATTTSAAAPALTFGATPTAPSALNFGLGGGTTQTFGSTSFSGGGLSSATTAMATPPSGLSFGVPKPAATTGFPLSVSTPASTAPKLNFGLTSAPASTGFSLGGISSVPASTATVPGTGTTFSLTPAASTTPQIGISVGSTAPATGFGLAPTTQPLATGFGVPAASAPAPATTATTGFSLGGATAVSSTGFNLGSTAAPTISSGFTLNKTATTQAPVTAVATTAAPQTSLGTVTTVSSSSGGQVGTMNFCQLEESINKWTLELEEQEKAFVNQATQVNAWDKLLIANGEKIATLNQEVERVKLEQQQLEHELDYVVGQQKELQDCLVPLEKELASLSVSDPEREYTYRLAENLDKQLKQMSQDLKEIIEHLNEANRSQDSSDPIVQIGKILNAHMNSLQWLDQRTSVLGQKIQQIDQMHQNFRQENERSLSLAYN